MDCTAQAKKARRAASWRCSQLVHFLDKSIRVAAHHVEATLKGVVSLFDDLLNFFVHIITAGLHHTSGWGCSFVFHLCHFHQDGAISGLELYVGCHWFSSFMICGLDLLAPLNGLYRRLFLLTPLVPHQYPPPPTAPARRCAARPGQSPPLTRPRRHADSAGPLGEVARGVVTGCTITHQESPRLLANRILSLQSPSQTQPGTAEGQRHLPT